MTPERHVTDSVMVKAVRAIATAIATVVAVRRSKSPKVIWKCARG
jgi:hypothetical protein